MDLKIYKNVIDFSVINLDDAIKLGKVANDIINGRHVNFDYVNNEILDRYFNRDSLKFNQDYLLIFFYSLFLVQTEILKDGDCNWNKITQICFSNRAIYKHTNFSLIVVIIDRIYNVEILDLVIDNIKTVPKYYVTSLFGSLFYINPTRESFLKFLDTITEEIKLEHNYLSLNSSLIEISSNNNEVGRKLISHFKQYKSKADLIIPFVFRGLANVLALDSVFPIIVELIQGSEYYLKVVGIRCLTLLHRNSDDLSQHSNKIEKLLAQVLELKDNSLTGSVINCYGVLLEKLPNGKELILKVTNTNSSVEVQMSLSFILLLKSDTQYNEEWYKTCMLRLINVETTYRGVYGNITSCFLSLRTTNLPLIFEYFEKWISKGNGNSRQINLFEDFFIELARYDLKHVEYIITKWLNSNDASFHVAASTISVLLWGHNVKQLNLDKSLLDMMVDIDIEFILYKIAGNIHIKEHLESLVYSSLQKKEISPLHKVLVINLFVEYIIYNYPSAIDFLKGENEKAEKEISDIIVEIISESRKHFLKEKVKVPEELLPSIERIHLFSKKMNNDIQKSMKKESRENRKPMLLDFISKVNLKTGGTSFVQHRGVYSQKTALQNFSESFEAPRGEFIDPLGQAFRRLIWLEFERSNK